MRKFVLCGALAALVLCGSFVTFSGSATAQGMRNQIRGWLNWPIKVGVIATDMEGNEHFHVIELPYLDAQSLTNTEFTARTPYLEDKHCPIKITCKVMDAWRTESRIWEKVDPNDVPDYKFAWDDIAVVYKGYLFEEIE